MNLSITLSAYQQQTYGKVWSSIVADGLDDIVASDSFAGADQETQAKMLSNLYSYAAQHAKAEVFDEYEVDSSAAVIDQLRQAGLSLADCIVWKTETTGMDQTRKFQELLEWDVEDDAKQAVIGTIIGTELETDAGNPSQYAKMLDALEQGLSVDQYLQMRINGTDMDDYLELVDGGMDSDAAYEFSGYMDEAKVDGNVERWRVCVDYFDDVEDQLTALSAVMTDAQFRKVGIANDFGVNPDTYVTLQEIKARYDADGSGTYNQKEIRAAIEGLPGYYTMKQKAVLWQLATGSTSAKNNPYSREVGQQVLTAKASDEEQAEGENSTFEDEVLKQLLGLG